MKILRFFAITFVSLAVFAVSALLGVQIGASFEHGFAIIATAFVGFLVGSGIGILAAIAAAKFFADNIWPLEKKQNDTPTSEYQPQQTGEEERQRVEKYGHKIVICSSCGTKNSLSFSHCLKCSKDLSSEQPVDNPYL